MCHSVHRGGLCIMSLPVWLPAPMSLPGGGLCQTRDLCQGWFLSGGWGVSVLEEWVSVQGISVQRVSVQGGFCLGGLCPGGLCPGGLCQGVSDQVSIQGVSPGGFSRGSLFQTGVSVQSRETKGDPLIQESKEKNFLCMF